MSPNEYQRLALRTEAETDNITERLLQGVMGLCGESGECLELMKKHKFHKHPLDLVHMAKELGDVQWYLAVAADAIGYSLDEIMQMNIKKLEARYPDGHFASEKSMYRKEGDV